MKTDEEKKRSDVKTVTHFGALPTPLLCMRAATSSPHMLCARRARRRQLRLILCGQAPKFIVGTRATKSRLIFTVSLNIY